MWLKSKVIYLILALLFTNIVYAENLEQTLSTDVTKSEHVVLDSNTLFKQQFNNAFDKFFHRQLLFYSIPFLLKNVNSEIYILLSFLCMRIYTY